MKAPAAPVPKKKLSAVDFAFLGLGLFVAALCGLTARSHLQHLLTVKTFLALLLASALLLAAPWVLRPRLKQNLLLLLVSLLVIELFLEGVAWAGLLPGVNTKQRLPWGRVYWTGEGRGNGIRNRHGWYYPGFNLTTTNRIALIGDSFVEAVEIKRGDNLGVRLGGQLAGPWKDYSVLSLGNHGTGPAHYLEVLQYAHRNFQVREAVLVLYLGNDLTDCSAAMLTHLKEEFFYYHLDPSGRLSLTPHDESKRARYAGGLEAPHQPPWLSAPWILSSHCMSVQIPLSIRDKIAQRRRNAGGQPQSGRIVPMDTSLAKLGLKAAPFAVQPDPATLEALTILTALLQRSSDFCAAHGIKLRIVTVPFFPSDFYATQQGAAWSSRLGDFDFLKPEREITAWATQHNLSVLPLGEWMQRQKLDVSAIRSLYFTGGSGHFTEAGHRFIAGAMAANFYATPEKTAP